MTRMFCFQCEQTANHLVCDKNGTCGKRPELSSTHDRLTSALIGLSRTAVQTRPGPAADAALLDGLFATVTNVNFDPAAIQALTDQVQTAQRELGGEPTGDDYQLADLWTTDEDIRSLKSLLLFGIRGMAAYAYHALVLGQDVSVVTAFMYRGLAAVGDDSLGLDALLALVLECGQANLVAMELLDQANTGAYGTPSPATVPLTIEPGPFIVISGHDLHDLKLLLEQTEGRGVNVYTHGEMLPAHGYPELRRFAHLKGNFGTAWQSQQKEFAHLPAPILFTTNCLMEPRRSYADRVFTTAVVGYPGMTHIGADKDFSPVIDKALALGGYTESKPMTGINGGTQVTTGFGHGTVLSVAGTVIEAVKSGDLRHIFLVGGCDGADPGRNYYTEFVKQTPPDSLVLTLACGKYRFNDLDLGQLGGLPRILDMGQCNDAYSAIKVALALAEAFNCSVNDLPLTLVLSWYEQKAVAILLTLLHLGVTGILLGPTLPVFISPNVLDTLVANYGIRPTSTPEADLAQILGDKAEALPA